MGYTTKFKGKFALDRPLSKAQSAYLHKFRDTRRMRRDAVVAATIADPIREAVGLPIGVDGGYFVGGAGFMGQDEDASCVRSNGDTNTPPINQPSLWCQWIPTYDRRAIRWDGGEKFYRYVDWLKYLVRHFIKPWGYVLSGHVRWRGEDSDDTGEIVVINNKVTATRSRR